MNVIKEINKINDIELQLGVNGSWHDEYKDSAYIFVGGLHLDLSEGDVITIFSQYGEVMDVNLPRDKETGKTKGFGFLMYEDQRSTVLAVDNLNGAKVLDRTLRVDHVKNYKQPRVKGEDGEWEDAEEQSLNAKPHLIVDDDGAASDSSTSSAASIDPEDPMRDYLISQRKEAKALKKTKKKTKTKGRRKDETPEERRARKERKKEKKARKIKSEGVKGVQELLENLGRGGGGRGERPREPRSRSRSGGVSRHRARSHSPIYDRNRVEGRSRSRSPVRERTRTSRNISRSPPTHTRLAPDDMYKEGKDRGDVYRSERGRA